MGLGLAARHTNMQMQMQMRPYTSQLLVSQLVFGVPGKPESRDLIFRQRDEQVLNPGPRLYTNNMYSRRRANAPQERCHNELF